MGVSEVGLFPNDGLYSGRDSQRNYEQVKIRTLFLHELIQLLEISDSASWGSITTISEEVYVHLGDLGGFSGFEECEEVIYVRVDSSI